MYTFVNFDVRETTAMVYASSLGLLLVLSLSPNYVASTKPELLKVNASWCVRGPCATDEFIDTLTH